ncbi:MAG TPA: hypothetical protein VMH48_02755 [Methylomirabilota bacterium]|nr:hypothetical protein [Methylomirabilota bacterium]
MKTFFFVVALGLLTAIATTRTAAQANPPKPTPTKSREQDTSNAGPCKTPKLPRYTVSPNSSGETIEGPACVQASSVNTLRNFIFITTAITQTAGPSPSTLFPSSGDKSVGGGGGPAKLTDLEGRVRTAQNELRLRLDSNRTAAASLDDLIARLREFIAHSDESVGSGHFDALVAQIKTHKDEIDRVIGGGSGWKATDDIVRMIHAAQNDWANFSVDHPEAFTEAATKTDNTTKYNALKTQLDDLETKALQQASGSDASKAVGKNVGLLAYWRDVFAGFLAPDGSVPKDSSAKFMVHQDVPCRTVFNMNRTVAVKLTIGDRLPVFDGQQISTQTHDAFVTVTCTSPFSLSAGVAFSSIEQREFAIVQSAPPAGSTTLVNKFGYSAKSAFHPLPLAMAHMRFYESDSHRYAVHATFGVAANIQGSNAGGSNAEYLPGLSFSLFRTMYLTAGVHIGKQASLAGGFNVGDVVPAGITSPPLQTSYKVGAGFAVTFTKP